MKKIIYAVVLIVTVVMGFWLGMMYAGIQFGKAMEEMMAAGEMPPPAVVAVELAEQPLDVLDDYIARIEPVQEVMIRSEVSGYIAEVHFKEGSFVKEGDLLFSINPDQYRAMVDVRKAELEQAEAELKRADQFLKRMKAANSRSVSQSDIETAESGYLQAAAMQKQAEAALKLAEIDLGYAEVRAPISGRIGMAAMTKGNYVTPSSDALAHIVQINPVRVTFSITDREYLDLKVEESKGQGEGLAARVRLPNGLTLPLIGKKEFEDNAMNPGTGTLAIRYLFDNPDGLLIPGGYVNVLLGQEERLMGIRIPQKSVLVDKQGSYVLTVTPEGQVGTARVELGQTVEADLVVLSGLSVGDRIVVEGVQKVQPGMQANVMMQGVEQ